MAALFGHSNPLGTPVGQKIEKATDGTQATENWALFMEICDFINETDDGAKDAIKAFRKRLSQNMGKNSTAIMYTLTCLETCVKNCGRRFHIYVANKDFLQEMIKVIGPKYDPPQAVQEKVLQLIQTWADAFSGVPELKEVEKVYHDLKSKGIEFPMTDLDNMVPILTPARSVPQTSSSVERSASMRGQLPPSMITGGGDMRPIVPNEPVRITQDERTKLRRELEVVSGNVRVMSEMLTELSPVNVDPSDLELLQELHRTNRQMQQRIMELLGDVANEEVTNELLRVNDDLNNVFLRYERFERYRNGQTGPEPAEPSPGQDHLPPSYDQVCTSREEGTRLPAQSNPAVGNLIDFDDDRNQGVSAQLAGLNITSGPKAGAAHGEEDFDMFAQSRQSFEQNKQASGSAYGNQKEDQFSGGLGQAVSIRSQAEILALQDKESDYDEMEQWLATHKAQEEAANNPVGLTSSEFDRFLMERAAASETLPNIPAQTGQHPASSRNTRQLRKDEEESPLFAL